MIKRLFLALMMAVLSTGVLAHDSELYTYKAEVIEVKDGDTMNMRIDMGLGIVLEDTVRVIDLDTPETWRPRNEAEKLHGKAATKRATELLQGPVTVVVHGRGSFGRVLAEIVLEDGTGFSSVMKSEGFEKRPHY